MKKPLFLLAASSLLALAACAQPTASTSSSEAEESTSAEVSSSQSASNQDGSQGSNPDTVQTEAVKAFETALSNLNVSGLGLDMTLSGKIGSENLNPYFDSESPEPYAYQKAITKIDFGEALTVSAELGDLDQTGSSSYYGKAKIQGLFYAELAGEAYDAEGNELATGSFAQPYSLSLDEDLHLYNDALYLDLSETTAMTLLQMMAPGSSVDMTGTQFVTPSIGYTENLGIDELIAANLSSIVETLTGLASLNQLVTIVEDDGFYEWTANIPGELLLALFIETSTQAAAGEGATAEDLEAIRQVYEKALEGTEIGTLGLQLDYSEDGYFELTLNPLTADILFNSGNYAMTDTHVFFEDFALNLILRTGIEVDDSWKPAEDSNYVPLFGESGTSEAETAAGE